MLAVFLLTIKNWVGWISLHKRLALAVVGIVALLVVLLWARGCYVDYKQGQVTKDLNNANKVINKGKDDSTVIEAERDRQRNEVINADVNSNKALNAVNDARHTDSSKFNGNISTARQRFCQLYPDDQLCR